MTIKAPAGRAVNGPSPSGAPRPPPSRRRFLVALGALGVSAMLSGGLLALIAYLAIQWSWPHREPPGNPQFGINFSCNHAEYLLLEDPALGPAGYVSDDRPGRPGWCAETLGAILDATGARFVRISVEWSQVEPREGAYDFRVVDALLEASRAHGARVLLTVGMKGQRHPEYYLPAWLLAQANLPSGAVVSDNPVARAAALRMVEAVARHVAVSPVIDAWSADNEPLLASPRASGWTLGADFVAEEVRVLRAADPQHRPVVVAHAQHWTFDHRWEEVLAAGDILGASIYPFRRYEIAGRELVVSILEFGPITPNYADQARTAKAAGKDYWLTEMQAEPFADGDPHSISPVRPASDMSAGKFRKNVDYARRSGASRVYLWGAEWWLYQREHYGDASWLALAREAMGAEPAP